MNTARTQVHVEGGSLCRVGRCQGPLKPTDQAMKRHHGRLCPQRWTDTPRTCLCLVRPHLGTQASHVLPRNCHSLTLLKISIVPAHIPVTMGRDMPTISSAGLGGCPWIGIYSETNVPSWGWSGAFSGPLCWAYEGTQVSLFRILSCCS